MKTEFTRAMYDYNMHCSAMHQMALELNGWFDDHPSTPYHGIWLEGYWGED